MVRSLQFHFVWLSLLLRRIFLPKVASFALHDLGSDCL